MVIEGIHRGVRIVTQALVALVLATGVLTTQAAPVTTLGTWYGTDGTNGTLQARDINGNPVPLLVSDAANPAAVFLYDTSLDVTWYNYDPGSSMTWDAAMAWAAGLTVGGFDDWQLPDIVDGAPQSALGYLWNVTLGNLYEKAWDQANTGPFQDPQSFRFYWLNSEDDMLPNSARSFYTYSGGINSSWKGLTYYALAVRSGDVVAAVPEPRSLTLALFGLAVLWVAGRRRSHRGFDTSQA